MKRVFSAVVLCAVLLSCCVGVFAATEDGDRASNLIKGYFARVEAGSAAGDVRVVYNTTSNVVATSIGVSSISIYKSDGSLVTTVYGNPNNGFIARNTNSKSGSYTYKGTSGVSYYAKVYFTVIANGGEKDTRSMITGTATAK